LGRDYIAYRLIMPLQIPDDFPLNRNVVLRQSSTPPVALVALLESRPSKSDEYFDHTGFISKNLDSRREKGMSCSLILVAVSVVKKLRLAAAITEP
jgi:hypothetical protein